MTGSTGRDAYQADRHHDSEIQHFPQHLNWVIRSMKWVLFNRCASDSKMQYSRQVATPTAKASISSHSALLITNAYENKLLHRTTIVQYSLEMKDIIGFFVRYIPRAASNVTMTNKVTNTIIVWNRELYSFNLCVCLNSVNILKIVVPG